MKLPKHGSLRLIACRMCLFSKGKVNLEKQRSCVFCESLIICLLDIYNVMLQKMSLPPLTEGHGKFLEDDCCEACFNTYLYLVHVLKKTSQASIH